MWMLPQSVLHPNQNSNGLRVSLHVFKSNPHSTTRLRQLSSTPLNVQPTHLHLSGVTELLNRDCPPGVTAPSGPMPCGHRDLILPKRMSTHLLLQCTVHRREKIKVHHPAAGEDKLFFVNTRAGYIPHQVLFSKFSEGRAPLPDIASLALSLESGVAYQFTYIGIPPCRAPRVARV